MIAELEWSAPFTFTSFVTNMADDSWQADNASGQTRLTIKSVISLKNSFPRYLKTDKKHQNTFFKMEALFTINPIHFFDINGL